MRKWEGQEKRRSWMAVMCESGHPIAVAGIPSSSSAAMPYLDEFLKSITSLPSELKDSYSEIRELDERFQECQKQLEEQYEMELETARKGSDSDSFLQNFSFSRKATDMSDKCKEIAERKIRLATQTYEKVDGHVRRLDKYLRKFDQELKRMAESELTGAPSVVEQKLSTSGLRGNEGGNKTKRKKKLTREEPVSTDLDLPIDPHEPTYCICNRVSFGNMIACDNENCKIEWFHFECVGITEQPKGKWYCPDCAPKMKQRKRG